MTGLMQLISLLVTGLLVYTLINVIGYIDWKKKHDKLIAEKLDRIIIRLSNDGK